MDSVLSRFVADLQKQALPGLWTKGLQLSRQPGVVHCDRWQGGNDTPSNSPQAETPPASKLPTAGDDEIVLRVRSTDRPVAYQVTLWPEDGDAHCTCPSKVEPCEHVIAAALALKAGLRPTTSEEPASRRAATTITPILSIQNGELWLQRELCAPGHPARPLEQSATATAAAIQSGRLALPPLLATAEDYRLDGFFTQSPALCCVSRLNGEGIKHLLATLRALPQIVFSQESENSENKLSSSDPRPSSRETNSQIDSIAKHPATRIGVLISPAKATQAMLLVEDFDRVAPTREPESSHNPRLHSGKSQVSEGPHLQSLLTRPTSQNPIYSIQLVELPLDRSKEQTSFHAWQCGNIGILLRSSPTTEQKPTAEIYPILPPQWEHLSLEDQKALSRLRTRGSPLPLSLQDISNEWLPRLARLQSPSSPILVQIRAARFPTLLEVPFSLQLELHRLDSGDWSLRILGVYGGNDGGSHDLTEPLATLGEELVVRKPSQFPRRDPTKEALIRSQIRQSLGIELGQVTKIPKDGHWQWRQKLKAFLNPLNPPPPLLGNAIVALGAPEVLVPHLSIEGQDLSSVGGSLKFEVRSKALGGLGASSLQGGLLHPTEVISSWKRGENYIELLDGRFAEIPQDWLEKFGDQIAKILSRTPAETASNQASVLRLRGQPFELLDLATSLKSEPTNEISFQGLSDQLKALVSPTGTQSPGKQQSEGSLRNLGSPLPAQLPLAGLRAGHQLRSYQEEGIRWLRTRAELGLGACLGDDMGLGKTLQAILASNGLTLVVVPASVVMAWRNQIETFTEYPVHVYYGPNRKVDWPQHQTAAIDSAKAQEGNRHRDLKPRFIITTYGILKQDEALFLESVWNTLIIDEAQTIKNPDTQVAKLVHALRANFRICLTGTPIENHVGELWSIYRCVLPGLLGSREEFDERWAAPIRMGKYSSLNSLRNRIRPFFLRRLKSDVAKELPERQEVTLVCELSEEEQRYYQAMLLSSRAKVLAALQKSESSTDSQKEAPSGIMQALELLLRLRQASCHPALGPSPPPQFTRGEHSTKTRVLVDSLKEAAESGHRSLVFSQWTQFLDLLEPLLKQEGITFDRLDGSTRDRPGVVSRFQQDGGPSVLLLSLKAGGTGLTLTAADHVYLMDPWWNPAVEAQAADRAHRLGQTRKVLIHRLISSGTVEEKISLLQSQKKRLADALLSDGSAQMPEENSESQDLAHRPAGDTFRDDLLALIQAL